MKFKEKYTVEGLTTQKGIGEYDFKRRLEREFKVELFFEVIQKTETENGVLYSVEFSEQSVRKIAPGCDVPTKLTHMAIAFRKSLPCAEVKVDYNLTRMWEMDETVSD